MVSFGYFLDLCWAQAFGLISGAIQQELNVSDADIGDIFVAFSAGLTVGAFFWGLAADIIGRKWCAFIDSTCWETQERSNLFDLQASTSPAPSLRWPDSSSQRLRTSELFVSSARSSEWALEVRSSAVDLPLPFERD